MDRPRDGRAGVLPYLHRLRLMAWPAMSLYNPNWDLSSIPAAVFNSEIGRRRGAQGHARPKVLAPCRWCGVQIGAVERRGQCPHCGKRQKEPAS